MRKLRDAMECVFLLTGSVFFVLQIWKVIIYWWWLHRLGDGWG